MAGLGAADDALLADDHRLCLIGCLDHADRAVAGAGHRGRRRLDRGARGDQRVELSRIDIVHDQLKTALRQIERHRAAHIAEPDKPHFAGHRVSSLSKSRRA